MTDVALKEYLESLIEALDRKMELQREADRRAVDLATSSLNHRLDSMNLFRSQILEERALYVRVDTFKWTVGFIVTLVGVVGTMMRLWR
jgi:hypothetical protein